VRRVALTFDDGPGPDTPALLAALAARGAPATFFLHGASLRRHGPPPRAYLAAGHELGDHAVHHVALHRRPVRAAAEAVALRALAGAPMRWWRPPYGAGGGVPGLVTVGWDVDPRDWSRPGAEVIAARVLRAVRPGSIVLLHDGRGDRAQTVAAVPRILDGLAAYGLAPVTLTALFAR
jgi:peptidoglycan/xylan/chitin deacetylase (PgdA/CDA1 family)